MSSFYNIHDINFIERGSFEITLRKAGFASTVEILRVGINVAGSKHTDWTKSSIITPFPWDGFVTFTCTKFYFYFTGEEYTVCVEILDQADGKTSYPSKNIIFPLFINISDSFQISEIPTQQSQNVYYDNKYKGSTGSCVANAIASAIEIQSMRRNKGNPTKYPTIAQGSIGWFWGKTGISESEGTNYNTALSALVSGGIPPYQVVNKTNGVYEYPDVYFLEDAKAVYKSTRDISAYAEPQRIEKFDAINPYENTLTIICDAIKNPKLCVLLSIAIDSSIENSQTENSGIVPPITNNGSGGHVMIVLGWQTIQGKKYWVCKNSWCRQDKTPLGQDGYYFIPFSWGALNSTTGIASFYVLKDDDNAPLLPELPITIDAFMIGKRHADGVTFGCTTTDKAGVTRYRLRWVEKESKDEIYTYSTNLAEPTFEFNVEDLYNQGARCGYTYIVDASAEINGIWSKSNSSVQITLLPLYSYIDYITSPSSTSLAVKLQKQMNDVGKFSFLRVFMGKENTMQQNPSKHKDFKDIFSYDDLAVFDGLTTGDT